MRRSSGIARLVAGVTGIIALIWHLIYSLGSGGSAAANFFSYFTTQSAIAAVTLWCIGGIVALRRESDPHWLVTSRLLATSYQVVSGVVYTVIVLQAVSRDVPIQVPLSSQILHYWMPAFAVVDWLVAPGRGRVGWAALRVVLLFPLLWGAFTMARGAVLGWYPYYFLDPYQTSGPLEFAASGATVLAFIVGVASVLVAVSAVMPRPRMPRPRRPRPRRRSGTEERLKAAAGSLDDLIVGQVGERDRSLTTDEAHQNR